jgi:hypothetical protein
MQDTLEKRKIDAVIFGPFWNEIIRNLREEDYVTNLWVLENHLFIAIVPYLFYLLILHASYCTAMLDNNDCALLLFINLEPLVFIHPLSIPSQRFNNFFIYPEKEVCNIQLGVCLIIVILNFESPSNLSFVVKFD